MVQRLAGTTSLHRSGDLLDKHNQLFPSPRLIQRAKPAGLFGRPPLGRRAVCPSQSHKCCAAKMTKGRGKKVKYKFTDSFTCLCELFFFPGGKRESVGEYRSQLRLQHTRRWLVAGTAPPGGAPAATSSPAGRTALPGPALAGAAAGPDGTGRDGTGLLKGRAGPGGPRRCREAEPPRPAPASPPAPRPPPRRSGRAAPQLGAGPG